MPLEGADSDGALVPGAPIALAPTVSFTPEQAGAQITRDNATWNATLGPALTITYAFRDTAPTAMPDDTAGFTRFNAAQIATVQRSLQAWSDVARITFNNVSGAGPGGSYSNSATMLFGNYDSGAEGAAAFAYFPGSRASGSLAGDVWVNSTISVNTAPATDNYGAQTLVHEIGHALGLSHPGAYDAGPGVSITYDANAEYIEDSRQYTVMSYFSASNTGANHAGIYAAAPLLHDIYAIQRLYGAATNTLTGDTTYGFNSNTNREWLSTTSNADKMVFAVWDNGGTDTFDFSGYTANQRIDLTPGNFSDVGGLVGNVAIHAAVTIENATGGTGGDTIQGNAAANVLSGLGGNDTLNGGGGNDTLLGGTGDDQLFGDAGGDQLIGGTGADRFGFRAATDSNATTGYDIIQDFVSGTDKIDLSNLTGLQALSMNRLNGGTVIFAATSAGAMQIGLNGNLQGTDLINPNGMASSFGYDLVGDGLAETLIGSAGNDRLFGVGGADILMGGAGNDQLFGDLGADQLFGEAGADLFAYRGAADSNGIDGYDIIKDFVIGVDKIDFYYLNGLQAVSMNRLNGGTIIFALTATGQVQVGLVGNVQGTDLINPFGTPAAFGYDLVGDGASETLIGSGGNDRLFGAAGNDTLQGGRGQDFLSGGAGADIFKFLSGADSNAAGYDIISDFQSGVDKIDLRGSGLVNVGIAVSGGSYFVFANGPGVESFQLGVNGVVALSDILTGAAAGAMFAAETPDTLGDMAQPLDFSLFVTLTDPGQPGPDYFIV
jgi:serralysin